MYREIEKHTALSYFEAWERLRTKFRASFPNNKTVLHDFGTAKLDEAKTTASCLCFSVESVEIMTRLDTEYGHFLQQLWYKITGRNVRVVITVRPADTVVSEKAAEKPNKSSSAVGMRMMSEESTVENSSPAGVLSPTVGLEIENFVDAELRRHKCFTPALCIGYVYGRYNVNEALLKSRRRNKDNKIGMTKIRRIAVYLTRTLTSLNKNEIGRQFNGMGGRFVAVAIKEIDNRRAKDPDFNKEIQDHIEYLRSRQEAVQRASAPVMFVRA